MYNTVIFDLDGTLLNTLGDLAAGVNHAMVSCGYPTHTPEEVQSYIGNGIDVLIRRSIPEGCTEEEWEVARDVFKAYYTRHMTDKTTVYEGIRELLTELRERGIRVAVVTNKDHVMANKLIPDFFGELIPCIIGTDLTKRRRKPAPDGIYTAMEVLGASPENTVYVGDTEVDVETAHNAGLKCIGVMWGFRCNSEITGADRVVEKPREILEYVDAKGNSQNEN